MTLTWGGHVISAEAERGRPRRCGQSRLEGEAVRVRVVVARSVRLGDGRLTFVFGASYGFPFRLLVSFTWFPFHFFSYVVDVLLIQRIVSLRRLYYRPFS